jgi:hypothetical protein
MPAMTATRAGLRPYDSTLCAGPVHHDGRIVSLVAGIPSVHSQLARELANGFEGFRITPHHHVRGCGNHADRVDVGARCAFRGKYVT